jgi:hypothetical protein
MEVNPGDNPIIALFLVLLVLAGCTVSSVTSGPPGPVSVGPQVEVGATSEP